MVENRISADVQAVIRAAVDEKYGDGTSALVTEYQSCEATQSELAIRLGVSQSAISQKIRTVRTYTRRLLRGAGLMGGNNVEIT